MNKRQRKAKMKRRRAHQGRTDNRRRPLRYSTQTLEIGDWEDDREESFWVRFILWLTVRRRMWR